MKKQKKLKKTKIKYIIPKRMNTKQTVENKVDQAHQQKRDNQEADPLCLPNYTTENKK